LFTALFSTISIIEDRHEGFLQSVLVSPISPMAIVMGKLLGGSILAAGQGLIFLLLAPLIGVRFSPMSFAAALIILWIVGFALTGLGFCIAWRMSSTQGFHAILNLFLMPMWFLSGALFPAKGAMKWVMGANPLTYGLAALRRTMYWSSPSGSAITGLPGWQTSMIVSILFAIVMFLLASGIARSRVAADLQ
ncbi:MAG TPA: ABC transporter permease, partial [Tepidisphaeraceae bacterium]|nr:ABC transporter permease [Tepidisphaeraceae bacterium]